ncbi:MAG TPA: beta-ketoacyl-ACP synthase [Xanthobacteraceae bacterium]|jgi:3-oxoacyl-[acyl-carrier-protein] synthase II|nr:beta-ketoacyl-ACP synthase [Xanthobacteraceae bacterium]
MNRETWITGVGILSCLGEGPEAHWQAFASGKINFDAAGYPPYIVHPLPPVNFDAQIPKKGDQRQMEPWQRIGVYAAGLALDSAGVKGNADILGRMDMIVAAGGGERDLAVDGRILSGLPKAGAKVGEHDRFLNERLMSDLRPTLFLAQLSNLLAGNISIVHGVTGSSRTFMGEESAGVDAVRIALARIRAGQSDITLVGGAQNSERKEMLMLYEFGGFALKGAFTPVWDRAAHPGFALGSMGAFLVLEASEHARSRGAKPLARLAAVVNARSNREPGAVTATLHKLWATLPPVRPDCAVISGACGAFPATAEERAFLDTHAELAVRATGTRIGHGVEPHFAMNIALAAMAVERRALFPPCDAGERAARGALTQAVVTGVGHWRGEGLALVEAVE